MRRSERDPSLEFELGTKKYFLPVISTLSWNSDLPAAVYATLLDEGEYHCSVRTMYRLLEKRCESINLTHPPYQKPELLATANQLWSWDMLGPAQWTYFYPYVILDF
jgi:hypothetical protein